jgi:ADP-ribose pyrophosphatase
MPFERDDQLFEKLLDRQVLPGSTYLTFARDTVLTDDGAPRTREVLLHPGAVTVVAALSNRQVLLVRQYRHAAGEILFELPAGTLEMLDDGSVEEPLSAAKRELFEETGYRAQNWRRIAEFFTAPGFATEFMQVFLATDVEYDESYAGPDEDERLQVKVVSFDDALGMAENGTIRDAKTLVGLYLAHRLSRRGELPELA